MFYDKFVMLCAKKGEKPCRVIENLGMNKSSVTNWKHGQKPRDYTLCRVADYFGVTPQELGGGADEKSEAAVEAREEP